MSPPPPLQVLCFCLPIIALGRRPDLEQAVRCLLEEERKVCGAALPLTPLARKCTDLNSVFSSVTWGP